MLTEVLIWITMWYIALVLIYSGYIVASHYEHTHYERLYLGSNPTSWWYFPVFNIPREDIRKIVKLSLLGYALLGLNLLLGCRNIGVIIVLLIVVTGLLIFIKIYNK